LLDRELYDMVPVDSRTGFSQMGGICAYQLADVIVAMCAPNQQNLDGTRDADQLSPFLPVFVLMASFTTMFLAAKKASPTLIACGASSSLALTSLMDLRA
jgi:hypothetical protein